MSCKDEFLGGFLTAVFALAIIDQVFHEEKGVWVFVGYVLVMVSVYLIGYVVTNILIDAVKEDGDEGD